MPGLFYLCYNKKTMRIGAIIGLSVLIILTFVQIGVFYRREKALEDNFAQVLESAKRAEEEYKTLQADYQYYQNPANLEKELRARFNYHSPDEKLIVIVSKPSSTAATASSSAQ